MEITQGQLLVTFISPLIAALVAFLVARQTIRNDVNKERRASYVNVAEYMVELKETTPYDKEQAEKAYEAIKGLRREKANPSGCMSRNGGVPSDVDALIVSIRKRVVLAAHQLLNGQAQQSPNISDPDELMVELEMDLDTLWSYCSYHPDQTLLGELVGWVASQQQRYLASRQTVRDQPSG